MVVVVVGNGARASGYNDVGDDEGDMIVGDDELMILCPTFTSNGSIPHSHAEYIYVYNTHT